MQRPSRSSLPDPQAPSEAAAHDRNATFRDVFGRREYRAVLSATALSWVGDYMAKAAVTALVFNTTGSVAGAAITFAISFAPWVLVGPILSTMADRYPYRTVMIVCDLLRMVTIGLVAVPGVPVPVMVALLFLTALGNPPYNASRSALLPKILPGDLLVVGISVNQSTGQAAQILGYLSGGLLAQVNPRWALIVDAATFAVSAILLTRGLQRRPAADTRETRQNLLQETGAGFRMVMGTPILRSIALVVFTGSLFVVVPEGLAVVWAHSLNPPDHRIGLFQGLIMLSGPMGVIAGNLVMGRLVRPSARRQLIRPLATLTPLALTPALLHPTLPGVIAICALSGFFAGGMLPASIGLFTQALPLAYRARAFGVMQSGLQLMQGASVVVVGVIAGGHDLPTVLGLWCVGGAVVVAVLGLTWPPGEEISLSIDRARRLNEAAAGG